MSRKQFSLTPSCELHCWAHMGIAGIISWALSVFFNFFDNKKLFSFFIIEKIKKYRRCPALHYNFEKPSMHGTRMWFLYFSQSQNPEIEFEMWACLPSKLSLLKILNKATNWVELKFWTILHAEEDEYMYLQTWI